MLTNTISTPQTTLCLLDQINKLGQAEEVSQVRTLVKAYLKTVKQAACEVSTFVQQLLTTENVTPAVNLIPNNFLDALMRIPKARISRLQTLYSELQSPINTQTIPKPNKTQARTFRKIYTQLDIYKLPKPPTTREPELLNIFSNLIGKEGALAIPVHDHDLTFTKETNAYLPAGHSYSSELDIWMKFRGNAYHPFTLRESLRELCQNFADAHRSNLSPTLEGVKFSTRTTNDNKFIIRIEGQGTFHPDFLLLDGGTTKQNDPHSIGNHGDGSKTAIQNLLQQYNAEKIEYGSRNWSVEFKRERFKESNINGIARKIQHLNDVDGSFCEITIPQSRHARLKNQYIDALSQAINLFYYPDNPGFHGDQLSYENSAGGFALDLNKNRGGVFRIKQGTTVELDTGKISINPFPGFSIWSNKDLEGKEAFHSDRNRLPLNLFQVDQFLITPVIQAMSNDELVYFIGQLEYLWNVDLCHANFTQNPQIALLARMVSECKQRSIGFDFSTERDIPRAFSGITPLKERDEFVIQNMQANNQQTIRVNILKRAAEALDQAKPTYSSRQDLSNIYLYDARGYDYKDIVFNETERQGHPIRLDSALLEHTPFKLALLVFYLNTRFDNTQFGNLSCTVNSLFKARLDQYSNPRDLDRYSNLIESLPNDTQAILDDLELLWEATERRDLSFLPALRQDHW